MVTMKTILVVDLLYGVCYKMVSMLYDKTMIKIDDSKDLLEPVPSMVIVKY